MNPKDKEGQRRLDKTVDLLRIIVVNRNTLTHGLGLMPEDDDPVGNYFILDKKGTIGYITSPEYIQKQYIQISALTTEFNFATTAAKRKEGMAASLYSYSCYS